MALPEQIQKQSEAVQELYKQFGVGNEDTSSTDETPPQETTAPNVEDRDADTEAVNGKATQPPAPEPTPQGGSEGDPSLLQKYRTLQGMFNAEVPRLQGETRRQNERIQQLEQLLAAMNSQQSQQPKTQPVEKKEFVSQQDIEDYGDSIDMMRRVTQEGVYELQQRIGRLEQTVRQLGELGPQVKAVVQKQAMTAEQTFWAEFSRQVPNWQEINNNEQFKDWLMEIDPMTGFTRQTFLDDAQQNFDVGRVATIFNTWVRQTTGSTNGAQTTTTKRGASELDRQVAPGKTKAGGPPPSNTGKQYSTADIQKFYDDVRKGLYKDRPEDRARMEADIFAAQRDGRLIVS